MITFEEAKKIALEWNDKCDTCQEYDDVYEFFIDDGELKIGGSGFMLISKEDGRSIPWALYFLTGDYNVKEIGEPVKI
ncbi:MAG: hypothetical protein IJV66_01715 [Firmicutes bacterium]|nr:hypothetical protein [Bacillota bacterium]